MNALGYNLGISSLIDAILKNQFRQVSLAMSGTWSGEKFSTDTYSVLYSPPFPT